MYQRPGVVAIIYCLIHIMFHLQQLPPQSRREVRLGGILKEKRPPPSLPLYGEGIMAKGV